MWSLPSQVHALPRHSNDSCLTQAPHLSVPGPQQAVLSVKSQSYFWLLRKTSWERTAAQGIPLACC